MVAVFQFAYLFMMAMNEKIQLVLKGDIETTKQCNVLPKAYPNRTVNTNPHSTVFRGCTKVPHPKARTYFSSV